jgi:hypothetical protein
MSGLLENSYFPVIPEKTEIQYLFIFNVFPPSFKKEIIYKFSKILLLHLTSMMLFSLLHSNKNNENNKHPAWEFYYIHTS